MGELFSTDGVRGKVNEYPMTAEMAMKIGQAVVSVLKRKGHRLRIVIGKDTRLSGYMLESALSAGITSMGGEESGHIIFLDYHTTGDGIVSGLQLLTAMKRENKLLSELSAVMKTFPQVVINVEVKSKPDLKGIPEIGRVIKDVEGELGEKGRVLVRYSGTQPLCRVMVEGPTKEETENFANKIAEVVKKNLS